MGEEDRHAGRRAGRRASGTAACGRGGQACRQAGGQAGERDGGGWARRAGMQAGGRAGGRAGRRRVGEQGGRAGRQAGRRRGRAACIASRRCKGAAEPRAHPVGRVAHDGVQHLLQPRPAAGGRTQRHEGGHAAAAPGGRRAPAPAPSCGQQITRDNDVMIRAVRHRGRWAAAAGARQRPAAPRRAADRCGTRHPPGRAGPSRGWTCRPPRSLARRAARGGASCRQRRRQPRQARA